MERNLLLFVVFVSQEEFQSNPIVCVQFYLWNIAQLLRSVVFLLDSVCVCVCVCVCLHSVCSFNIPSPTPSESTIKFTAIF